MTQNVNLDWADSVDNVGVTEYLIYRDGIYLNSVLGSPPVSNYQDPNVANGGYIYEVSSNDAAGNESAKSISIQVNIGDTTPPSVPANLIGNVTTTSVTISWDASTDNVGVAAYIINVDGTDVSFTAGNDTNWVDSPLQPNVTHTYKVKARDGANNDSAYSSTLTKTTLADTSPPTTVSNFSANAISSTSVFLQWTAASDNVAVKDYVISRNNILYQVVTAPATSYTDTACTPGTGYIYQVAARDTTNNLGPVQATSVTTPTSTLPPNVYPLDPSIDKTGNSDVAFAITQFIKTVPNGTAATPNIVLFPAPDGNGPAKFKCEDIVYLENRKWITLKGNGSYIWSKTDGFHDWDNGGTLVRNSSVTAGEWYSREWPRRRISILIKGADVPGTGPKEFSTGVRLEDFEIIGHNVPGNIDAYPLDTTTLTAGIDATQTTITVATADLAKFKWFGGNNQVIKIDNELMRIVSKSGTTWTVERGKFKTSVNNPWFIGGSAASHSNGAVVKMARPGGGAWNFAYLDKLEFQSGIEINADNAAFPDTASPCSNIVISNVNVKYVWGDGLRVSESASGVNVVNCIFEKMGRQGITPDACYNLTIDGCTIRETGRSEIDMEPAWWTSPVRNITIKNSTFGWGLGKWMANEGQRGLMPDGLPNVHNIIIDNNTSDLPLDFKVGLTPPHPNDPRWDNARGKITVTNNINTGPSYGSPVYMMNFWKVKGLTVKNNRQSFAISGINPGGPIYVSQRCQVYDSAGNLIQAMVPVDSTVQWPVSSHSTTVVGQTAPGSPNPLQTSIGPNNWTKASDGSPINNSYVPYNGFDKWIFKWYPVPSNTGLPVLSVSPAGINVGNTLKTTNGSWDDDVANGFSWLYQWLRCDSAGNNPVDIAGQTGLTYILIGGDIGSRIRCKVTATNPNGSTIVTSNATAVVT